MDFEDDDDLFPLPRMPPANSPKRLRRRPPFAAAPVIVSSTVVPSLGPDQVISTLIDSLTAISQTARDQLKQQFAADPEPHNLHSETDRSASPDSFYADIPLRRVPSDISEEDEPSDEDVAAAPVIRLARAPPTKKARKTKKDTVSPYLSTGGSVHNLSVRSSMNSLRSQYAQGEMGVPSIERANGSSTSLAPSMRSARSPSPLKEVVSEPPRDRSPPRPMPPRRAYTDTNSLIHASRRSSYEVDKENKDPVSSQSADTEQTKVTTPPTIDEQHTISALSLRSREILHDHLIPNRRSSVRSSSESKRLSLGHRDLKDLNIDEDLIGSDDSTVKRIRELQEAREKRQHEWRKEARRSSERSSKRNSHPSPKSSQKSIYTASKLQVTEVLVESEQEIAPDVSATLNSADLHNMPALGVIINDEAPLTPVAATFDGKSLQPTLSPPAKVRSTASRRESLHSKSPSTASNQYDSTTSNGKSIAEEVEAFVSASRLTQKLRHPRTGRTIAFSETGDPNGFAVICCVGMGLTRYVTSFYDDLARTLRLRLITPDRPGCGESDAISERLNNPLTWVDDIAVICQNLEISRFSLLAHSAGAIYALATALKMPQYVRGRIHLLAPWIPPSQMPKGAAIGPDSQPLVNTPMSHRLLSVLPAGFLKMANSRFLSAAAASNNVRPARNKKNKLHEFQPDSEFIQSYTDLTDPSLVGVLSDTPPQPRTVSCYQANNDTLLTSDTLPYRHPISNPSKPSTPRSSSNHVRNPPTSPTARTQQYNSALTHRIWSLSTLNANPATDLLTCFERKKTIGFRYAEVTRSVVIRHGAKDARVPLDNVRWLQTIMKRCELRVLEDEGHSLMANAKVMGDVLAEVGREWEEWERIAREKGERRKKRVVGNSNGNESRITNGNGNGAINGGGSLRSWGSVSIS